MKQTKWVLLLALMALVLLGSCGTLVNVAQHPTKSTVTIGLSAERVIELWGQPDQVLTYPAYHTTRFPITGHPSFEYHYEMPDGGSYCLFFNQNTLALIGENRPKR